MHLSPIYHISFFSRSRSESLGDEDSNSLTFPLDISEEVLKKEINNFAHMVEKMEYKCRELSKYSLFEEEEEDEDDDDDDFDNADLSRIGFVGTETKMVGLFDEFSHLKKDLLKQGPDLLCTSTISGMAGIGKTTMAKKIYYDPKVCNHFNCRLWVAIGQKYQLRKIMLGLLAQLNYDVDNMQTDEDEKLGDYLYTSLRSRRYLIVLDDIWDLEVLLKLTRYLPFNNKKGQILLTTRIQYLAQDRYQILRFMNEEESWCLLREKVFGEKLCPYQFEKLGQKIAKKCDGLSLLIVTVADLLSKAEKTLGYWTKIAKGEDKSIFIEANDKISDILLRSYRYLRQDSKARLLYMGVFPPKCEVPTSKLFNLWIAEDISRRKSHFQGYLRHLISCNLILAHQDAAIGGIKTCSLHSSFWYACVKQSWKEKFLHVRNNFADIYKEGVKSQRRLCTYNNVLFGIKEVYDSMASISSARSIICSGPNHQYPVPICFGLRLLKVLDVFSIRFYKFPIEVLKLIHLRYLALTYDGKVPSSISKLWNLKYLIVHRYLSIKVRGDWSYLPVEIWNMQNLRRLQVMGSCLPYLRDALLPKLLKLSGISAHSCTQEIFQRIPNLKKLGIQIELVPNSDATESLSCFDHLSHLYQLQSLKCAIVNPSLARPQLVAPPAFVTTFPLGLKKLSLSGFGYSWIYMRVIGQLPNLKVLKLRSYAFRGSKWELYEDEFKKLRYLLLEDLDLVHVTSCDNCSFPKLRKLIIKHCYKFRSFPLEFSSELMAELVDSPLIEKFMVANLPESHRLHIHSSWEDGELKA